MSNMSGSRLANEADYLKKYFDTDPRFEFIGLLGSGLTGAAFGVKYNDIHNQSYNAFIVKRAVQNVADQDLLRSEEQYLKSLRGAMHVVQVLEIENNPLDRPGTEDLPALRGAWVILEYLANGSIDKFLENASQSGRTKLPNRLLWRFFLCMIKACIAITYPRNISTDPLVSETVPAGGRAEDEGMTHNDIHVANVMLADVLEDIEHTITPRLKLIDFGRAADFSQARRIPSPSDISSIAEIILSLILLNPFPFGMHASPYSFQADADSPEIYTHAIELTEGWVEEGHEDLPWLDPDLKALVCNLMREDRDNIPSLADIDRIATAAVRDRDAAWYNNEEFEQDDTIKKLWHDIVHWDGGDDGGGGDDGDLDDGDYDTDDEDDYEDDYEDRYLDDFLGGLP